jgi:protein phosphatase
MTLQAIELMAARSSIQGTRSNQEDFSRFWWPHPAGPSAQSSPLLVVVADGMGGHAAGEVASRLACEAFISAFSESSGSVVERLKRGLKESNAAIAGAVRGEPQLSGMGCTLVAAHIDANGLRWTSVGDSLLYLFRDRHLVRLNEDHSLGAYLDQQASGGIITFEEARSDPRRNSLLSALTGDELTHIDAPSAATSIKPDDILVVATDGLATLDDAQLLATLDRNANATPEEIAARLLHDVQAARAASQDNTTVAVIKVMTAGDASGLAPGSLGLAECTAASSVSAEPGTPVFQGSSAARKTVAAVFISGVMIGICAGYLLSTSSRPSSIVDPGGAELRQTEIQATAEGKPALKDENHAGGNSAPPKALPERDGPPPPLKGDSQ